MPLLNIAHSENFDSLTPESTDEEIRANQSIRENYGDLLDRYPNHPVVISKGHSRVVRWKKNEVVDLLIDGTDLNALWAKFYSANLPVEDMATVYRLMGYSLCGFLEVFDDLLFLDSEEETDG